MLAEASTKDISEAVNPQTMNAHAVVAQQGGEVVRNARLELEQKTGQKVVTSLNAKSIHQIDKHKEEELIRYGRRIKRLFVESGASELEDSACFLSIKPIVMLTPIE